jgi:hypothetical protein
VRVAVNEEDLMVVLEQLGGDGTADVPGSGDRATHQ